MISKAPFLTIFFTFESGEPALSNVKKIVKNGALEIIIRQRFEMTIPAFLFSAFLLI